MSEKKIYTIATAHLDTIWSWDFETTVSKYIYNTLHDNFALFDKYSSYRFNFEGAYRYELMQEYYPEEFEKMRSYVKSGRWNVCGSSYENGDVNVPSPEALFRNILIGNNYFDKTFGKRSKDIFLPDCFGFGWALPSVAAHSNLMGFTTQKLTWGSAYGTPFDIGYWQGVDGEKIFANVNPHDYYFTLKKLRDWDFIQDKLKDNEKYGLDITTVFHGIGDRGGAPKEESVAFVDSEIKKNDSSDVKVVAAGADEVFHDLNKMSEESLSKLPVWDNELVMKNHGVGGYTSRAVGKRWNRRCEELADIAERSELMAYQLGASDYNKDELTANWKRFIIHQFHDDLPGTSVQREYRRSWNDYAMAMNRFTGEIGAAQGSVSSLMKTDFCSGTPVMVTNVVECDRKGAVKLSLNNIKKSNVRVYDEKGREVRSQVNSQIDGVTEIVFIAEVPAYGVRVYDVRESDVPCRLSGHLSISTSNLMENDRYIVSLNRKGNITSILDKAQDERELISEPISLGLFKYKGSKEYPAWEMVYEQANKDPERIPNVVTITVLESGPARVAFLVEQSDKKSTFRNVIALTYGGEVVEVYSEFDWRNMSTMAKNKFAFNCSNEKATFDLGLGAIERGNMTEKLYEVPAQKWVDLTDKSGEYGISVISECKYGWDKYKDNTLRMTVVHTPSRNYRVDSMQSMLDFGLNRYSYAIYSHKGNVGADTQLQARLFIQPMTAVSCSKHKGTIGTSHSFISVSTNDIIIRAIKMSENGDEVIVRLNEGANMPVDNYKLTIFDGIESATEVYASEEYKADAVVEHGTLVTSFKPYEIKTFALKLKQSGIEPTKCESTPAEIVLDKKIITKNGENGDFELTIPRELISDTLTVNGVTYNINKNGKGAVCAGQKVKTNGYSRLCMLISSDNDKSLEFGFDGEKRNVKVYSRTQRFAMWDMFDLRDTAYIKDGSLGYIATHSHTDGKDNIAKQLYFYVLTLDVTGVKEVMLPTDSQTVVLAASLTDCDGEIVTPTHDSVKERTVDYSLSFGDKLKYLWSKTPVMVQDKQEYLTNNNKGRGE